MRNVVFVAVAFVFGVVVAASYLTYHSPSTPRPDSIEVYRPECTGISLVADTIIINRFTGRPEYTIRLRYGDEVIEVKGEAVNHPPSYLRNSSE